MSVFMLSILLILTAVAYVFYVTVKYVSDTKRKKRIRREEILLREQGIVPYSVASKHGMYVDKEGKINTHKSIGNSWYKRLL